MQEKNSLDILMNYIRANPNFKHLSIDLLFVVNTKDMKDRLIE